MPFVEYLHVDERVGVFDKAERFPCKSMDAAYAAIRQLDGHIRTEVLMQGPERELSIGGGNQGRYAVALNTDREFFSLVDPLGSAVDEVTIVAGGQRAPYPARLCIDLSTRPTSG